MIRFGSVCSGIEAASVAWHPLGWRAAWFSEIEAFPSAVLSHHYPDVPNLGDMTKLARAVLAGAAEAPDVLVGGTPCQSFSVAGLREGLADARGQLTVSFVELANAIDAVRLKRGDEPAVILWENVPGVLSDRGNAFGCFLGALAGEDHELKPSGKRWPDAGCVYGPQRAIAWRVLAAQYFGLAQRRRRVFVVASAREGLDPASILFEFSGRRRDFAPSRGASAGVAASSPAGIGASSHWDGPFPHPTLNQSSSATGGVGSSNQEVFSQRGAYQVGAALDPEPVAFGGNNTAGPIEVSTALNAHGGPHGRCDFESETFIAHTLRAEGFDASEDGTGRGTPLVPVHAFDARQSDVIQYGDMTGPLDTDGNSVAVAVAYPILEAGARTGVSTTDLRAGIGIGESDDPMFTLQAGKQHAVGMFSGVRRLTPRECERLQGFPDDYTLIPLPLKNRQTRQRWAADGPRYKALGNSMAVPVMRWIGRRIDAALRRLS